jgi:HAD superfamily hydrolase (TIGR01490 family)
MASRAPKTGALLGDVRLAGVFDRIAPTEVDRASPFERVLDVPRDRGLAGLVLPTLHGRGHGAFDRAVHIDGTDDHKVDGATATLAELHLTLAPALEDAFGVYLETEEAEAEDLFFVLAAAPPEVTEEDQLTPVRALKRVGLNRVVVVAHRVVVVAPRVVVVARSSSTDAVDDSAPGAGTDEEEGRSQEAAEEAHEGLLLARFLRDEVPDIARLVRLVLFDFDKTLVRIDSGRSIALPMFRRGLVGPRPAMRFAWNGMLYMAGLKSRSAMQEVGYSTYAGFRIEDLIPLLQELWPEAVEPTLSPPVVARLRAHQEAGDHTVLLTASPAFVAHPASKALEFDSIEGTQMEIVDGLLTGRPIAPLVEGSEKARRAQRMAHELGIDPADCVAYTDSIADLELLEWVGTPVAVGPDRELAAIAAARGWEVLLH